MRKVSVEKVLMYTDCAILHKAHTSMSRQSVLAQQ